jgi:hypothetical protein
MNPEAKRVVIPEDRSLKQPSMGFCRNPACRDRSDQEFTFVIEHDPVVCPKCGADQEPMIGMLVMTHLLIPDPAGPISGSGGLRYHIACDVRRAYLATATNLEAVTDNVKVANCPGCLAVARKLGVKRNTGQELVLTTENE